MSLTAQQKATLKTAILAAPDLAPMTSGAKTDYVGLVNALNADASPAVAAWSAAVTPDVIDEASNWTSFDGLTAGKRDSWAMFMARQRDFTRAKVRSWVVDVWGSATANSAAAGVLIAGTVPASRAQAIIGGNAAAVGSVSALRRSWDGLVELSDIVEMFSA